MTLSTEQLKLRKHKVGASIVASILGMNPWRPPIDAYLELTGEDRPGPSPELQAKAQWGHVMEDVIAEWYKREHKTTLMTSPSMAHKDIEWALATPDRICWERSRLVECKNVGARVAWHWYDGVPEYVTCQAIWQLWVVRSHGTMLEACDVVACVGGIPPEVYPVQYDEELAEMMVEAVREFYLKHVVPRIPPPVDGTATYKEFLARKFPNSNGVLVYAPEAEVWATKYEACGVAEKRAKEARQEARNHLLAIIGENDGAKWDGGMVTMRRTESGNRPVRVKFDWKKEIAA